MRNSKGFTPTIDTAIVLVIIGLLLGGVLKGQELITGARVRNLISQQDGIKAAFFGFQDRYRALPGDYASASSNIKCSGDLPRMAMAMGASSKLPLPPAASDARGHHRLVAPDRRRLPQRLLLIPAALRATRWRAMRPRIPYSIYLQIVYDAAYGDPATRHRRSTTSRPGAKCRSRSLPRSTARSTTASPIPGGVPVLGSTCRPRLAATQPRLAGPARVRASRH